MTTEVDVEIDLDDFIEEIDTADLEEELQRRLTKAPPGSSSPSGGTPVEVSLGSWDGDTLREAIRANDAYRVLDIMKDFIR